MLLNCNKAVGQFTLLLLCLGAVNQLYENDLIADKGHKGEVFAVTCKGYEYADNLGNLDKSLLSRGSIK